MGKFIFSLLCIAFASGSHPCWADPFPCNPALEGTYTGKLYQYPVRVNFFCIDSQRFAATICPSDSTDGSFSVDVATSLTNTDLENNQLIVAGFQLNPADRRTGSSKSMNTYVRLDLPSLMAGKLSGEYISAAIPPIYPINAAKTAAFPNLASVAAHPLPANGITGAFSTDMPQVILGKGTNIVFDVIEGMPIVSLVQIGAGTARHFTDGLPWNSNGVFSVTTAEGNGGELDDFKMWSIRGHFFDEDHFEFYVINPVLGLEGPFKATRLAPLSPSVSRR
jgi:hypothetical protein